MFFLCWGLAAQDPTKPLESVKKSEQKQGASGAAIEDNSPPGQINPESPPKEQTIPIVPPSTSDPHQGLWYAILGISSLSILALGFTTWKLKAVQPPAPNLEPLVEQVNAARKQASEARSRYDELASRVSRPVAAPPRRDLVPQSPQPPAMKEPQDARWEAVREPLRGVQLSPPVAPSHGSGSGVAPRPPARPRDELVDAYHLARTSSDRTARDQFENRYPYVRISCINHDEWQFHKSITLRFQKEDYGWYLMVSHGGSYQAFPWFTQDLAHERESFNGVFDYPVGSGDAKLRLVRPALLQSQGDGWILASLGEVQADV
jgi:hypothetical protein